MHNNQIGVKVIRIGMGVMFFFHGLHKFLGGGEELNGLGKDFLSLIGGPELPTYPIGFMAAAIQLVCGLSIAAGFQVFKASLLGLSTMLVATVVLLSKGEPFSHYSHPVEFSIILIGLALMYRNQDK